MPNWRGVSYGKGNIMGTMTVGDKAELPIEILNQIVQFAAQNGRSWKAQLLGYWYRGEAVPGFPLLYGLRNHTQYGPRWLNNVKLPHILKLAGAANCSNRKETL